MLRHTFEFRANPYIKTDTTVSTFQLGFGSDVFLNTSVPGTVGTTSDFTTFFNATVSPTSHTARVYVPLVVLDIPCASINSTILRIVHIATGQDVQYVDPSIRACVIETCGGQGISCPGLIPSKACTPGTDSCEDQMHVRILSIWPSSHDNVYAHARYCISCLIGFDCTSRDCCAGQCAGKGL
jgi:hypothetical protein